MAASRKKRYLSTEEAAAEIDLSAQTLKRWRKTPGLGPPYRQHGGNVRYLVDDLRAWDEASKRT